MRKLWTNAKMECLGLAALGAITVACNGQLGGLGENGANGNGSNPSSDPSSLASSEDPGFKGIHRLNSREYDNTIRDLLGTSLAPGVNFLNETADGFDNVASSLGMTTNQYTAYFKAAGDIAADVFANSDLKGRLLVCATEDAPCAEQIVEGLGTRTFRRPIEQDEVTTFMGVYGRAVDLGLSHEESLQQVLRAFLSSAEFLYRMEFDEDPDSVEPHKLNPYELASRLSYFLWNTMPDESLMSAAADGSLAEEEVLSAQVDRLLADTRSQALVDTFAAQWLGLDDLESHAVIEEAFPEWNEELRSSMMLEASLYLNEYIRGGEPWEEFLVGDFTFLNDTLGAHYGRTGMTADFQRTDMGTDGRTGFMGLGAFLTLSSFPHRTGPTLRAKWILEEILCSPPAPPPTDAVIAELDDPEEGPEVDQSANIRERLEQHRAEPTCAACHAALDPLGMALEHYDAIGRYRDNYENGDPVDATGEMPDGTQFASLQDLATYLAGDERFVECSTEKLLVYGVGRGIQKPDKAHIPSIVHEFKASGDDTYRGLVKAFINSVPFSQRRGGDEE